MMKRFSRLILGAALLSMSAMQASAMQKTLEQFTLDEAVLAEEEEVPATDDPNSEQFTAPRIVKAKHEKPVAAEKKAKKKIEEEPAPPRDIPIIETQNESFVSPEVSYVTGGIGDEERTAIESAKDQYNLYIMSASIEGQFVGDARIIIRKQNAKENPVVLNVVSGPLLYVKLPMGRYSIDGSLGEKTKHFEVTIGKKSGKVHFAWKAGAQ